MNDSISILRCLLFTEDLPCTYLLLMHSAIPSNPKWTHVPTSSTSAVPDGATMPFMTCLSTIQCPVVLHPRCHMPNKCTLQGCTQKVHTIDVYLTNVCMIDVCPTSASHNCALYMLVLEGTFAICHNPQVWNTQLFGSACIPSTQVYKIQSSSLYQSCLSCIILVDPMRFSTITPTLSSVAKCPSKLLLVHPTNASY